MSKQSLLLTKVIGGDDYNPGPDAHHHIYRANISNLTYTSGYLKISSSKIRHINTEHTELDDTVGRSIGTIMSNNLDIYTSDIQEIIMEGGSIYVQNGADIETVHIQRGELYLHGEGYIKNLYVNAGFASLGHGCVEKAHVLNKIFMHERGVINSLELNKNAEFMSGYRYSKCVSSPLIHYFSAKQGGTIKFKGDCCIDKLYVSSNTTVLRQENTSVNIGKLFVDKKRIRDTEAWLQERTKYYIC